MACFVYYDANGIAREFINSTYSRKGDGSDVNTIYFYCEGNTTADAAVSFFLRKPDGTTQIVASSGYTANVQVPYDPNRPLNYFTYFTYYPMYSLTIPSEALAQSGLLVISPTVNGKVYGVYNVMIDDSAVQLDQSMTMANFYYLLNYFKTAAFELGNFYIDDDGHLIWNYSDTIQPGTGPYPRIIDADNQWSGKNTFTQRTDFDQGVSFSSDVSSYVYHSGTANQGMVFYDDGDYFSFQTEYGIGLQMYDWGENSFYISAVNRKMYLKTASHTVDVDTIVTDVSGYANLSADNNFTGTNSFYKVEFASGTCSITGSLSNMSFHNDAGSFIFGANQGALTFGIGGASATITTPSSGTLTYALPNDGGTLATQEWVEGHSGSGGIGNLTTYTSASANVVINPSSNNHFKVGTVITPGITGKSQKAVVYAKLVQESNTNVVAVCGSPYYTDAGQWAVDVFFGLADVTQNGSMAYHVVFSVYA